MFAEDMDGTRAWGLGVQIREPEVPQCGTELGIGREEGRPWGGGNFPHTPPMERISKNPENLDFHRSLCRCICQGSKRNCCTC